MDHQTPEQSYYIGGCEVSIKTAVTVWVGHSEIGAFEYDEWEPADELDRLGGESLDGEGPTGFLVKIFNHSSKDVVIKNIGFLLGGNDWVDFYGNKEKAWPSPNGTRLRYFLGANGPTGRHKSAQGRVSRANAALGKK